MKFYYINDDYIKFLRTYDSKVMDNKNQNRPYIGTIIEVNGISYFAPLSSPKKKHIKMSDYFDFIKIDNGKLGIINLNNMIPVKEDSLIDININSLEDISYKQLLLKQLLFINKNEEFIKKKAIFLRKIVISKNSNKTFDFIKNRSCNLSLLESIYQNYKQK